MDHQYKPAAEMTEAEAKQYCEEVAQKMGIWEQEELQMALEEGNTYRQIAFQWQNS